jgi:thiol-disulfide isomerase/thioredoxin
MKSFSVLKITAAAATLTALGTAATPVLAQGEVTAKLSPSGVSGKLGYFAPQQLTLSKAKPEQLKKVPYDVAAPQYGLVKFGPKEYVFLLDEPAGKAARLFVDSNGNGDLTDEAAITLTAVPYRSKSGLNLKQYMGVATLPILGTDGTSMGTASLRVFRLDKKDPENTALKNVVVYYRDYGVEGNVSLGGKSYPFLLDDTKAGGDFSKPTDVAFLIDVNNNGKFDKTGESYPLGTPFNIGGTTYELSEVSPSGNRFVVKKSTQTVAEVLPAPDIANGKKATPFAAKTTAGEAIQFPESYKGKLVLLDFWATWCGPCIGELPNLTQAYATYHSQGFEILGISLDKANASEKLAAFTKQMNMPWSQVYDGKFWSAEVAKLYNIHSIPAAFLVDGDTGEVIASGDVLRGEGGLAKVLAEALAKKAKRQASSQ